MSAAKQELPRQPPRRILVVDDDRDTAESFAILLRELGHEAQPVTDAALVPDLARRMRPELVLLDIGMPGVNGWELAQLLRKDLGDKVWIVAITGRGESDARKRSREAGFDAHLQKPVDVDVLASIVAQAGQK